MTLRVHASKVALGAVLVQKDSKGKVKPVAFACKGLNSVPVLLLFSAKCWQLFLVVWLYEAPLLYLW